MKYTFLFSLLFLGCLSVSAQRTNKLDSTGNVGIGTLTPTEKLEISSGGLSKIKLTHSSDVLGTVGALKFNMAGSDLGSLEVERYIASGRRSNMKFFVKGDSLAEAMRIIETGAIGIGETSPVARLHVNGKEKTIFSTFTQEGVAASDAALSIKSATGTSGVYIPALVGRTYYPGRSFGLYIIGEAEDVLTTPDIAMGAIILDGRNKNSSRLNTNNVLAVNSGGVNLMQVKANGSVGIGTTDPGPYKLAVEGTIGARRVKVTQATPWADFVFADDYKLPSLQEVESFINVNKHLPEIPSAAEVAKEGIDLAEINQKLLQKIEEQMLYIIEMNKKINSLTSEMKELKSKVAASSL
ncbi:MAG: hypothetical protein J7623_09505 [Chitinophaga sp.]|uniref:hypothetical protein n=1 Tax=Chitinophaga sp. TaxID=1869181 RepID=UPI001B16B4C5|nr:hypothetical protein [Chitinophaga sp.]MBO9728860.1 hypothetical protein [Chitinophaga sp.]